MYVQWLLEFLWRVFIQGPLMVIEFFVNPGNINKIFGTTRFSSQEYNIISNLVSTSIILLIAIIIFLIIFIFKMIWIIIKSEPDQTKSLIVLALKAYARSIIIILVFTVCFKFLFFIVDALLSTSMKMFNNMDNASNISSELRKIPSGIYQLITDHPLAKDNKNFLFPSNNGNFLEVANNMNWIVSTLFVNTFSFFLIYFTWNFFQKTIEVFFLYVTFPVSIAFDQVSNDINIKVWLKEIINKIVMVFIILVLMHLFLYMYATIESAKWFNNKWSTTGKNNNARLYVLFFIVLALGFANFFVLKIFAYKHKEHVGIIGGINSFRQTKKFITNNQNKNVYESINKEVKLEPINRNINSIKNDIRNLSYHHNNEENSLRKVKIFSS